MLDPNLPPDEADINPFAGSQPIERESSKLALGGNILSQAGVPSPTSNSETQLSGEITDDAEQAARKACGLIAEMFIREGDPDALTFPQCSDIEAIGLSLQQLGNTPLGIGYGKFPVSVTKAWARFLSETTSNHRKHNNLEAADLVQLRLQLPEWLEQTPSFDILEGCELMDITIDGVVYSRIGTATKHCKISFLHSVTPSASIGNGSKWSTFIFFSKLSANGSFVNASNVSIQLKAGQSGIIGPLSESITACQGGSFEGQCQMKANPGCKTKNIPESKKQLFS